MGIVGVAFDRLAAQVREDGGSRATVSAVPGFLTAAPDTTGSNG